MKKKVLLTGILSIVMCLSLIAGATFALFTSESKVNIAVTSGNVEVVATVEDVQYKTLTKTWTDAVDNKTTFDGINSTAEVSDNGTVTLTNIVPGDGLKFNVVVNNNSSVATKYRVIVENDKSQDTGLFAGLTVRVNNAEFIGKVISAWTELPAGPANNVDSIPVEIEFVNTNDGSNNAYQGKACAIVVTVEAVQGNAETFNDTSAGVTIETSQDGKISEETTISSNGFSAKIPADTIFEAGATSATLVVSEEEANAGNFNLGGTNVQAKGLNISIPEVDETNDKAIIVTLTGVLDAEISGVILYHKGNPMVPVASALDVDKDGEFFYNADNGDVTLATNNFSNFTSVTFDQTVVSTEKELTTALSKGENVALASDITLSKKIIIKKNVIIDLNGYTLDAKVSDNELLQSSSDYDPSIVIMSSKAGAKINVGNKALILAYGNVDVFNVEINVGEIKSSNNVPFKMSAKLTLGKGTVVNVAFLGSSLINSSGDVVIDDAVINVDTFRVNGSAMFSIYAKTKLSIANTEINVGLDTTYYSLFVNRSANNVQITDSILNIVDSTGAKYDVIRVADSAVDDKYGWIKVASNFDEFKALIESGVTNIKLAGDITSQGQEIAIAKDKVLNLYLGGYTYKYVSTNDSGNAQAFTVKGTLNVYGGNIITEHAGTNLGWGGMTTIFNITDGGIVNVEDATAENVGGSDMAFVAHLNNWGEATFNAKNSTIKATYVAIRVFNSGYDMNNVSLENCKVHGNNYAFWVHNYTEADFGAKYDKDAVEARLNLDIYETNTLTAGSDGLKEKVVRYGFTDSIYFDINQNQIA